MLKNSVIEITLAKKNVLKRERESERKEIKYRLLNHKKKKRHLGKSRPDGESPTEVLSESMERNQTSKP